MKDEPRVEFSELFTIQRKALPLEIKEAFLDTLTLFLVDPIHPALRNHPLHGKYAGYRSIDVTDDYRAVFHETQTGEEKIVTFHKIGTHKELYEQQG